MARGDHHARSDVDLLVDAPPGTSALALCGLSIDAERLLDRPVDVVTERCLYAPMRARAVREAIPLHLPGEPVPDQTEYPADTAAGPGPTRRQPRGVY